MEGPTRRRLEAHGLESNQIKLGINCARFSFEFLRRATSGAGLSEGCLFPQKSVSGRRLGPLIDDGVGRSELAGKRGTCAADGGNGGRCGGAADTFCVIRLSRWPGLSFVACDAATAERFRLPGADSSRRESERYSSCATAAFAVRELWQIRRGENLNVIN